MRHLKLKVLDKTYTIHRFSADDTIPSSVLDATFFSIVKTESELSIVCDSDILLDSPVSESGWSCLKVEGVLDFSLTGILAKLSTVLADADISIFAISTYDTDYVLVRSNRLESAVVALKDHGYSISG